MYTSINWQYECTTRKQENKMPSESKTNTKPTRKPKTKLPKRQKDVRKLSLSLSSSLGNLLNSSLMSIHITHHTYNIALTKKTIWKHFFLKKFSSAAPSICSFMRCWAVGSEQWFPLVSSLWRGGSAPTCLGVMLMQAFGVPISPLVCRLSLSLSFSLWSASGVCFGRDSRASHKDRE